MELAIPSQLIRVDGPPERVIVGAAVSDAPITGGLHQHLGQSQQGDDIGSHRSTYGLGYTGTVAAIWKTNPAYLES